MKHSKRFLRFALTIFALTVALAVTALGTEELYLRVDPPVETEIPAAVQVTASRRAADPSEIPEMTASSMLEEVIKKREGFVETKMWDYLQYSIGYGCSYDKACQMFPSVAATGRITEEQAEALLRQALADNGVYINRFLRENGILLNQNQFDALMSFTYSVGVGWLTYRNEDGSWCLLKQMLLDSPETWTVQRAGKAFGAWVYAGGQVLQGLVNTRAWETELFFTPVTDQPEPVDPEPADPEPVDPEVPPEERTAGFTDVARTAWFAPAVEQAASLGLMQGYGDGRFGPDEPLTRAQAAQVLANFSGEKPESVLTGSFSDVPASRWYAPAVGWAAEHGIVQGREDGTFGPEEPISRQHLCAMLGRYLRSRGMEVTGHVTPFADDLSIQGSVKSEVYFCASLGIVNGVGEGRFEPKSQATRAQMAQLLVRMEELLREA